MKRKLVVSIISSIVIVLISCTLFFSSSIEFFLKLDIDLTMINEDAFEVHIIDVGQGDAIAVRFPNGKTLLVDSGPESGKENLIDYLDKIFFRDNYNTFDYVILTHSDIDHSGNMDHILDRYEVNYFYRPNILSENLEGNKIGFKVDNDKYDEILNRLKTLDITTYFTTDNAIINTGTGKIEMHLPSLNSIEETNDFSPFIIISSNGRKVCMSGDASSEYEEGIISRGVLQEVDLFKLAHHGSKYSNSEEFIRELSPKFVCCSVGENNYGHPASEVLLRLANFDIDTKSNTYATFKSTLNDGNIIYYVNDNDMEVICINNLDDYLFLGWYVVVIIIDCLVVINLLIIVVPKKKIHINKHLKNMKQ